MNHDESRLLYDRTLSVLAGGVNSSVRTTQPYPFFTERGDGAHVVDIDGNRYVDYMMGYGPPLYGHDVPKPVQSAVQKHAAAGPTYDAPTEIEVEHVKFVARHVPSAEMLRLVNSGTGVTISAIHLARDATDRDKIVVMQGGYHGAQESTLVKGGPDGAKPSTPGIPSSFADRTIPVPFNNEEIVREVFAEHGEDIAAVPTEPILANTGTVHPVDGYLKALRDVTEAHGALPIFDEVITGFRVDGLQCAQGKFGITPDLTTFGKIISGGFPIGTVSGKTELVEQFTPGDDVFQSGAFSGHPVTMAAGRECLKCAAENSVYGHINRLGEKLRAGVTDIPEDQAPEYTVVGTDSMFKTVFTRHGTAERTDAYVDGRSQVESCPNYGACSKTGADVSNTETNRWERVFWQGMKDRGVFLAANQFESQFVSYAHTDEDIEKTLKAYKAAL